MSQELKQSITPQALANVFVGKIVKFTYSHGDPWVGVCKKIVPCKYDQGCGMDIYLGELTLRMFVPETWADTVVEGAGRTSLQVALPETTTKELADTLAMLNQGVAENRQNEADWKTSSCWTVCYGCTSSLPAFSASNRRPPSAAPRFLGALLILEFVL